jgi:hypothetical protein
MKKLIATVAVVLALCVAGAAPASADAPFKFPIHAFSLEQGVFDGTFTVKWFGVENGALVASGVVVGTLVDENGVATSIYRTVTIPVNLPASASRTGRDVCDILHLELGPLDLDLLGLVVHLDQVVLDIDAVSGSGNLLGNLLCAIVGLLDGSNLGQLANLLTKLIGVLT